METNTKAATLFVTLSRRIDLLGDRLENMLTGQFGQDVRDLGARPHAGEPRDPRA